jgi:hypothetical protein
MKQWTIAGALLCALAGFPSVQAAELKNFYVRNAGDLVDLCSATPQDQDYLQAIHFCQGFAVGAYQYYREVATNSPSYRFICLPDPPPSRDEAIAAFVAWARQNPQYLDDTAVDALFRYLSEAYPCKP